MTTTLFKYAAYSLIGLSLAFVFLGAQIRVSSTSTALAQTTAPTGSQAPTTPRYNCADPGEPDDFIYFNWTDRRPNGGWVGKVTYGNIVNLPIQAYDAKLNDPNDPSQGLNWGFQAQDGSFVCRMFVSAGPLLRNVSFGSCNNNKWPQPACNNKPR